MNIGERVTYVAYVNTSFRIAIFHLYKILSDFEFRYKDKVMEELKMAYELRYCRGCIQMTNHICNTCAKCGTEDTSRSHMEENFTNDPVHLLCDEWGMLVRRLREHDESLT